MSSTTTTTASKPQASPVNFPLGSASERDAVRSLRSLIAHLKSENKGTIPHEPIQLLLNSQSPLISKKDYVPRIIPIPNRLARISEMQILIITKDPAVIVRDELTKKGSVTEDLIKEILPLKKLRRIAGNKKSLINLFQDYDLILCDVRVQHLLPDILGEMFYKKNKKLPFAIQIFKPTDEDLKKKRHERVDRCEAEYVKQQIKSIVKNTSYLPNSDTTISVKLGYADMKVLDLMNNMAAIVEFLRNEKFKEVNGGVFNKKNPLVSIFVKTSDSAALPVYKNAKIKESV